MSKAKNSSKRTKDDFDFDFAALNPMVARRVLLDLLERQPELKGLVKELADEAISNPRMEDLAAEIEDTLIRFCADDGCMSSG